MAALGRVTRLTVSRGLMQRVSQTTQVRDALRAQANRIAARARQLDAADGGGARISVRDGIRPQGRAYANVISDDAAGEFGTSKTSRRRTLGRAANIREQP